MPLGKLKLNLLGQTSFQLAPKTFWWAELISQFFSNLNSSKTFTCPSGKLRTEFTSPIANPLALGYQTLLSLHAAKPKDSPCTPHIFLYIGRIWQRSRLSWVGTLFHSSWNSIHTQNISLIDSILYVWKITIDRNFLFPDNFLLSLYKDLELFDYYLLPWLAVSSLSSICCISVSDHHHMSIRVPCNTKGSIAQYVKKTTCYFALALHWMC